MGCARRACRVCSSHSTRPNPRAWAWAYLSAARSSKPTADGCGRSRANRRVLSFSLRSLLTEPPSVIDVAYWPIAAPDVYDGTSAVGESRHRIPGASVGEPTEPCLGEYNRSRRASSEQIGARLSEPDEGAALVPHQPALLDRIRQPGAVFRR